jgi:hypothetical protein
MQGESKLKFERWMKRGGSGYNVFVIDYSQHLEVTEAPMH